MMKSKNIQITDLPNYYKVINVGIHWFGQWGFPNTRWDPGCNQGNSILYISSHRYHLLPRTV